MIALHKADNRVCMSVLYSKCASKDSEPFLPEKWKLSRLYHRIYILLVYSTTDIGCVDWHLQMGDWWGLFTKHVSHLVEEKLFQHNSQW